MWIVFNIYFSLINGTKLNDFLEKCFSEYNSDDALIVACPCSPQISTGSQSIISHYIANKFIRRLYGDNSSLIKFSGKPYIAQKGKVFDRISISHTKGWLVFAISPSAIGIDIENNSNHLKIKKAMKYITGQEGNIFDWVKLEASSKLTGLGLFKTKLAIKRSKYTLHEFYKNINISFKNIEIDKNINASIAYRKAHPIKLIVLPKDVSINCVDNLD